MPVPVPVGALVFVTFPTTDILLLWPNVAVPLAGLVNPAAVLLPSYGWVVIVMSYQGCFGSDCPLQVRTDRLCHPIQVTEPHTRLLPGLCHALQSLLVGCVTVLTNWIFFLQI